MHAQKDNSIQDGRGSACAGESWSNLRRVNLHGIRGTRKRNRARISASARPNTDGIGARAGRGSLSAAGLKCRRHGTEEGAGPRAWLTPKAAQRS